MMAVEWGTGQVLWSMTWFFLFALWLLLVFSIFADIVRSETMSGFTKAIWTLAIIFLPYLGIFMYLIIHGSEMGGRSHDQGAMAESPVGGASATSSADQLAVLASLRDAGKLTDDEYAAATATVPTDR